MPDDEPPELDYERPRTQRETGWENIALLALWGIVIVCLLRLVYGVFTTGWN